MLNWISPEFMLCCNQSWIFLLHEYFLALYYLEFLNPWFTIAAQILIQSMFLNHVVAAEFIYSIYCTNVAYKLLQDFKYLAKSSIYAQMSHVCRHRYNYQCRLWCHNYHFVLPVHLIVMLKLFVTWYDYMSVHILFLYCGIINLSQIS